MNTPKNSASFRHPGEPKLNDRVPTHAECVRAFESYSLALSNRVSFGRHRAADGTEMEEWPEDPPFYFVADHA